MVSLSLSTIATNDYSVPTSSTPNQSFSHCLVVLSANKEGKLQIGNLGTLQFNHLDEESSVNGNSTLNMLLSIGSLNALYMR